MFRQMDIHSFGYPKNPIMTDQKRAAIKQLIRTQTRQIASSKEAARAFLMKEGIYTKTGRLSIKFGGSKNEPAKVVAAKSRKRA